MAFQPPPINYSGTPRTIALPAGTDMYRVHRSYRQVTEFSPVSADPQFGGGRFDSMLGTGDEYGFLYAAFDQETALAEVLLRGIPYDDEGFRWLPHRTVAKRRLSRFENVRDLTLLALTSGEELATVCQDHWLIDAEEKEYPQTRRWATWLRRQAPQAEGMIWPSKRNTGKPAIILFEDRCDPESLKPVGDAPVDLDDQPAGHDWLNEKLAPYRVKLAPPRTRHNPV